MKRLKLRGPHKVGYGKPPKHTQFQKGTSGNPNGRPKGARNVGAVLGDIIQQKISVTENGRTRRMPALEVMLRRLTNDAMRGDPKALKLLLSLVDRYVDSSGAAPDLDEMLAEDQAILDQFLKENPRLANPGGKPRRSRPAS